MDERLGIMGILVRELLRLAGVTLCSDIIRCDSQEANCVCVYACVCVLLVVLLLFCVGFFCVSVCSVWKPGKYQGPCISHMLVLCSPLS